MRQSRAKRRLGEVDPTPVATGADLEAPGGGTETAAEPLPGSQTLITSITPLSIWNSDTVPGVPGAKAAGDSFGYSQDFGGEGDFLG